MPRRSTRTVEEELTEWLNAPWEEAEKQVDHGFSPRNTPTRSPKINLNLKLQAADAKLLGTLMRGLTLGMRQGEIEAEEQDEVRMSTAHRTLQKLDPSLRAALATGLRMEADQSVGTMLLDDDDEAPLSAVHQTMRRYDPTMLKSLASELEGGAARGSPEPEDQRTSTAHMTLRRLDPELKAMLQRGWGAEVAASAGPDEDVQGELSVARMTLRRLDPSLRAALARGFDELDVGLDEGAEGGLSAVRQTMRRMDPALRAALARGLDELSEIEAEEGDEGGLSSAQRSKRAPQGKGAGTLDRPSCGGRPA